MKKTDLAPWMGILLFAMVAFAAPGFSQTCVDSPAGLVGWWPADGNGADIESGFDAKLRNGAGYAPGMVGEAFSLNNFDAGQDDSVILPHMLVDGLADMSVELWLNTTDPSGGILTGANGNANASNEFLLFVQTADSVTPWVKQRSAGAVSATLSDGVWHHVAFVRAANNGTLYVDGVRMGTLLYPAGPIDIGPHGLQLGQEQDCLAGCFQPDQALDGLFDEVAIYDRALSETEILTVFNAGAAGKCKPMAPEPTDSVTSEDLEALLAEIDALNERLTIQEQALDDLDTKAPSEHGKRHGWLKHGHGQR